MTIKAINPKNQLKLNKFIKLNSQYDELVNAGKEETRRAYTIYDKANEVLLELPKLEVMNLPKEMREGYYL